MATETLAGAHNSGAAQQAPEPGQPTITLETAAKLLRLTPRRLQQLTAEGWIKKTGRGQYTVVGVVQGYLDFRDDVDARAAKSASQSRVQDARAREIEQRTALKDRSLIPIDEALDAIASVVGTLRTELSGLPARLSREIGMRTTIEREINASLNRVSQQFDQEAQVLRLGSAADAGADED